VRAGQPVRTGLGVDFEEGLSATPSSWANTAPTAPSPELGVAKRWWRSGGKLTLGLAYKAELRAFDFFSDVPQQLALEVGVEDRFHALLSRAVWCSIPQRIPGAIARAYFALATDHSVLGTYSFDKLVPEARAYLPLIGAAGRLLHVSAGCGSGP